MPRNLYHMGAAAVAVLAVMGAAAPTVRSEESAAKAHGPIAWTESLAEAQKIAAKEKKVIFIDFWAEWCGPCKKMLATTYKDKTVVARSKQFVPVLINIDKQKELAAKYKIEAIPTVIFMNAKGKVLVQPEPSLYTAKEFLKLMDEAEKKAKS